MRKVGEDTLKCFLFPWMTFSNSIHHAFDHTSYLPSGEKTFRIASKSSKNAGLSVLESEGIIFRRIKGSVSPNTDTIAGAI